MKRGGGSEKEIFFLSKSGTGKSSRGRRRESECRERGSLFLSERRSRPGKVAPSARGPGSQKKEREGKKGGKSPWPMRKPRTGMEKGGQQVKQRVRKKRSSRSFSLRKGLVKPEGFFVADSNRVMEKRRKGGLGQKGLLIAKARMMPFGRETHQ